MLDCAADELRTRIDRDEVERDAREWRLDNLPAAAAQPWLNEAADLVVDTTDLSPDEVVSIILDAVP